MSPSYPHQRVNTSRVVHTIGALLRAGREGDEKVQKNVKRWVKFLTGGGFAVYIAIMLLGMLRDQIRQNWKSDDRMITAIHDQTIAIRDQSKSIEALVAKIADQQSHEDEAHAILLERTSATPVATPTRGRR